MTTATEISVDVGWGSLRGLAWGEHNRQKILCLHGWMDNAASFQPLAECLPDQHVVALDYAGHGKSDHRPSAARYYLTDYFYDLDAALDALGWASCTLAAHSMGSAVASYYACANSERVERVIMIDGLGVVTESPDKAAGRLGRSLKSVRTPRVHKRLFESIEAAGAARQLKNPMSDASARLLSERALKQHDGGWRWRTDPRAMWESPFWMTEEQSTDILRGIKCPVLALVTPYLEAYLDARFTSRLQAVERMQLARLTGQHHVHMDEPEMIAKTIKKFMQAEVSPND